MSGVSSTIPIPDLHKLTIEGYRHRSSHLLLVVRLVVLHLGLEKQLPALGKQRLVLVLELGR